MSQKENITAKETKAKLGKQTTDTAIKDCVTVGFMALGNIPQNTVYGIEANDAVHETDIKYGIQTTDTTTDGCVIVGFIAIDIVAQNVVYGIEDFGSSVRHPTDEELLDLSPTVTTCG